MSYQAGVYVKQGANEQVIASTGTVTCNGNITIESGGKLTVKSGGEIEIQSGGTVDQQTGALNNSPFPLGVASVSATIAATNLCRWYTTLGATGAVVVTLPAASACAGLWLGLFNCVDQDMTLAGAAGELMFKNDLAANSLAYSTSSEKIGGAFLGFSNGTSWCVMPLAEEAQTITVAT